MQFFFLSVACVFLTNECRQAFLVVGLCLCRSSNRANELHRREEARGKGLGETIGKVKIERRRAIGSSGHGEREERGGGKGANVCKKR